METMRWINENKNANLRNAREIKKWMEERETTKPPASSSFDEQEARLGRALVSIRHYLIKPYYNLETEEERRKYREKYPEIEEVMEIVSWIDENKNSNLRNAQEIKRWMEDNNRTMIPNSRSYNDEERRLGNALSTIKYTLVKPYERLKTEEEKEKYKKEHPELEEILEIIKWINERKATRTKRQELDGLIKKDLEKRDKLGKARKLEEQYNELNPDKNSLHI